MLFKPGAGLQIVLAAEIVLGHEDVPGGWAKLQQLYACSSRGGEHSQSPFPTGNG